MSDMSHSDENIHRLLAQIRALITELYPEVTKTEGGFLDKLSEITRNIPFNIPDAPPEEDSSSEEE